MAQGWQLTEVQEALWHHVLSERVASGAGSREYVAKVLKAVVNACDRARQEVAEVLLENLLALRAAARRSPAAVHRRCLRGRRRVDGAREMDAGVARCCARLPVGLSSLVNGVTIEWPAGGPPWACGQCGCRDWYGQAEIRVGRISKLWPSGACQLWVR